MTPPILGIWASQISGHLYGPAGAYDAIGSVSVASGATASSITFTGIPTGYKHLQIRGIQRTDQSGTQDSNFRFNGDTGANYSWHRLFADGGGGTASASGTANASLMNYGAALGTATLANDYPAFIMDVLDYADSTKYKTTRTLTGFDNNGGGYIYMYSGSWRSTSPITTITFTLGAGNFDQYSQFALYGVK